MPLRTKAYREVSGLTGGHALEESSGIPTPLLVLPGTE